MMRHSEFFYSFCHPLPSTRTLLRALSQYHNRSTVTLVQSPFANLVLLMALSCSVFVDAHRITSNDYIPSNDDVLRAPVPVLTEIYFSMGQLAIRLCHISQRSERKKWIHSFENVTSIIFCASLADYNRFRYEQGRIIRSLRLDVPDSNLQIQIPLLAESLVLFESVINSQWFLRTPAIILFLNRIDEFKVKLPEVRHNLIHVRLLARFIFIHSSVSLSKLLSRVYRGRRC